MHLGMRTAEPHRCRPDRRSLASRSNKGEEPVIYHHAIVAAAAQERVKDLIAQSSADRLAESAKTTGRRLRWRSSRVATRSARGATSPTAEAAS